MAADSPPVRPPPADMERLLGAGAPIDAFGIGTRMCVSADAPSLDLVYKLVRFGGRDVLKRSEGEETWVGAKQLHPEYPVRPGDALRARQAAGIGALG